MLIFFICSMAFIAFFDFTGFGSLSILPEAVEMICQETSYLSLSQPHCWTSPPADSFSHHSSASACVSQLTKKKRRQARK
jgi:hypothetical protein